MRALVSVVVAAVEDVEVAAVVAVLPIVTSVVRAVAPAVAVLGVEAEATGEEHHKAATEEVALVVPLLVATHLQLRHMEAAVADMVEATAIHPVPEAAPGGKHHLPRYTTHAANKSCSSASA